MNFKIVLIVFTAYFLNSCGGGPTSNPWSTFKPLNEIDKHIQGYYDASLGKTVNEKKGNPAVYVDFSDGLNQAFTSSDTNKTLIRNVAEQFGNNPKNEWWGLGKKAYSGVGKLEFGNNSTSLRAIINNPNSYNDIYAPIEESLKKITASSNDALLITDFEEYRMDNSEEVLDFASKYFIDWIKKGNSITFKYSTYHEVNSSKLPGEKNLYFIFFTYGKQNDESLISQFTKSLLNTGVDPNFFELNNNPYTISNDYGGKENTGIANHIIAQWAKLITNAASDKKLPYEVIGISKPWNEDVDKYVKNIIEKEKGLFLSKLILNANDQSCFKLNKVAVKVYDVSDDYERFARFNETKNHIPVLTKNDKKDNVWDEKSKKDAIIRECYSLNSLKLKPEWVYKPADLSSNEWPEIFDLDKEIFAGHLKNDPAKISLNTVFHSNYKSKGIKKSNALIRIDYTIEDASPNIENPKLNDFSWTSVIKKENGKNQSLYSSVKRTLQESTINPKGKIIYSYYIKFANTKKSETN